MKLSAIDTNLLLALHALLHDGDAAHARFRDLVIKVCTERFGETL